MAGVRGQRMGIGGLGGGGSSLEPEVALALDLFNLGRELRTSGVEGLGVWGLSLCGSLAGVRSISSPALNPIKCPPQKKHPKNL